MTRASGGLLVVVSIALQDDDFVGAPLADLERAGAGVVGLQPGIAEVAVLLVLHRELLVDDGGDGGGHAVQHEGRRVGLVDLDGQLIAGRSA